MDEFKDFSEAPTPVLTFGTPVEEAASVPAAQEAAMPAAKEAEQIPVDPQLTEESLTPEERKMVDDFSKQIDLHDSNGILQYGAGTQKKMADFSENALKNVRTKDLGEVGDMITNLVTELKSFDTDEEKGFLGIFKKNGNKIAAMKTKYDKAEVNVEKICTVLEDHQVQLMKDVALLDKMYNLNLSYFKELSMYILAGKKRLEEVRATEVKDAFDKAQRSNLPEDAQAAKDLQDLCDRFEKKLHDLELTRMIAIQTGPQIRLVQSSDTMMIEKIQSTVVNTIPLWKSQMVIALGVEHANQAAQAQKEVTDMTNALLKKNAEKLKVATVESAKASERGIVDLETLKNTNATLISTLDEVIKIQEDGRQKRREAENELNRMEQELKNKLLEVSN
ncbi:MAG: toxic anion resistance protein [Lachnospiraceae bacterium]|nr:toxic anion resistance protein [Lachnospiraceae bacterium]